MLLAMPMLTASPEMKQAAMADEPKKETTYYGHTYTTRTYFAYMNCLVQDGILKAAFFLPDHLRLDGNNPLVQNGILKAAFFLPDHLRLDGNNPVYEVFLDKEQRQFLTYDHLEKKWRDAKLDRLEWPGRNYYATCWASEEDAALIQDYFSGERGGDLGILDFQRNVRDEQLEQRHKRITDCWDKDLAQVPELPKDWAPQQKRALHPLPASRNVQGPGTRRLLQNRPVLCLSGSAMQGWFCHPGIPGRQNLSKGYPAAQRALLA